MLQTARQAGDVDLERDRALVDRCQQGDDSAFEELYLRYRERLYRYCLRRLDDPAEAEDAVQETFARAWKALPSFAGERRFYPWLSVIANHLCVDFQRTGSRCAPVEDADLAALAPAVSGGQELLVERTGERDLLERALDNLSDRHRQVLELREGRNWTYQQIASHEGVEVSAIETLLFRARRSLRREFLQLARAEGVLGVLFWPVVLLRRRLRRAVSSLRNGAVAGKGAVMAALPSGAVSGAVAAVATCALVAICAVSVGAPSHATSFARPAAAARSTILGRLPGPAGGVPSATAAGAGGVRHDGRGASPGSASAAAAPSSGSPYVGVLPVPAGVAPGALPGSSGARTASGLVGDVGTAATALGASLLHPVSRLLGGSVVTVVHSTVKRVTKVVKHVVKRVLKALKKDVSPVVKAVVKRLVKQHKLHLPPVSLPTLPGL